MDPKHLSIVSASETGALIFLSAPDTTTHLGSVDAKGHEDGEIGEAGAYEDAALSPDGKQIAVVRGGSNGNDIWLLDTAHGHLSRFTFHPGSYGFPRWSADSRQLAFFLLFGGTGQACLKSLDGAERCPILRTSSWQVPMDFSADGNALLTWTQSAAAAGDIYTMTLGSKPALTPFLSTPFDEGSASVSPDGKWVAYQSNASLRNEVYVRRSTPSNEQWQISTAGGEGPVWSADGRELFYVAGDMVMRAAIAGGTTPNAGAAAPLFRIPGGHAAPRISGTLSRPVISGIATDKRFLFRLGSGQPTASIHVVLNWQNVLQ